jgi:hypothetical protein
MTARGALLRPARGAPEHTKAASVGEQPVSIPASPVLTEPHYEDMAAAPALDPCTAYLRKTTRKYEMDKYAPRAKAPNILQR